MKYLNFFGKQIAQISLGCDHYGAAVSEETAMRQLDIYVQQGGNLLDTAHIYGQDKAGGPSTSEQVLGKWLRANNLHEKITVASKGCHPYKEDMSHSRINEKDMMLDISQSLDQLKTDCLDIWFFHRDNPLMGSDEIIDLASMLIDKKLVKHLGVSNWRTERIEAANTWAKAHGKPTFEISEIQWSLARCTPETWGDDTLVCMTEQQRLWYEKEAMPVMCFAPQAKGLFSKLLSGNEDRLSSNAKRRFLTEENLALAPKVQALSQHLRVTPAAIAMAYLTSQKNPTIAIAGSSRVEQITETLGGADLTLTEEELAFLQS
ncbi:aldo/keto reductase [Sphaerochaeta globosa]|uniref:NADP-dependent oxidoreductase domain n=1 Tax=Sphaerochaeta globosa (strain ATCC BAA-1886 / DSM 22777 / Buddy) TaxID=158189 RepID=F0RYG6_SPHGB|nr:aldo/keto reductase [Sphaerochaeta globosa]ADY12737.1 NADP-dependent oxidoreductase domain [Sphaerochaeta globosa str. Buddy]